MLPNIAPPERIGFLSGAGPRARQLLRHHPVLFFLFAWSWNPQPLFGFDPAQHEPERAVGILAAIWVVIFACRCSSLRRTRPAPRAASSQAVSQGLRNLGARRFGRSATTRTSSRSSVARVLFYEGFIVPHAVHRRVRRGHPQVDARPCSSWRGSSTAWPPPSPASSRAGWIRASARKAARSFFVAGCLSRTSCCAR